MFNFGVSDTAHTTFIAIATILVVAGVPHIIDEVKYDIKRIFKNSFVKNIVIFCAIYLNTKDLYVSVLASLFFAIVMDIILAKPLTQQEIAQAERNTILTTRN